MSHIAAFCHIAVDMSHIVAICHIAVDTLYYYYYCYLCQTQQRSTITRKTKTHKQIYHAQHKAQTCVLI